MSGAVEFTIGAGVQCLDGTCGTLQGVIVESGTETITHLVVEPATRRKGPGRLVPIDLVESANAGEVRLGCTLAQYEALDPAESVEVRNELQPDFESLAPLRIVGRANFGTLLANPDGVGNPHADGARTGLRQVRRGVTEHNVPDGEGEIAHGQHVHASDGPIGRVEGLLAKPGDETVTAILLAEGHLWGEKEVAIPISAVKFVVDDGVYLNLTKREVEALPAANVHRPG